MAKKTPALVPLPVMLTELTLASWETIARRTWMMASGTCTRAEYHRMMLEKTSAAQRSAALLLEPSAMFDVAAIIAPWHGRAASNARRLRRRRASSMK